MTLYPSQGVADVHITMAFELCTDDEAQIYLPRIAQTLNIPQQALYVERDELSLLWVAIHTTLPQLPAPQAARIAAFLRVPIEDGWFPGPAPALVEQSGAFWHTTYQSLSQETERFYWEIRQPAYRARMEFNHKAATFAGGPVDWGFTIIVNHRTLGWFSASNPQAITAALTNAGVPLDGWYSAREAERQFGLAVMRHAGIF